MLESKKVESEKVESEKVESATNISLPAKRSSLRRICRD